MRMRGKHSQYTRDIYFWHSKVMVERKAINLSTAFDEKVTNSTVSGSYCPSMCATFQTNVFNCRILYGALFPLHYYKRTQWRKKKKKDMHIGHMFLHHLTWISEGGSELMYLLPVLKAVQGK